MDQVPEELRRLEGQTGATWGGFQEWRLNLDVANQAATALRAHGYHVDVLPATIPDAYLADVLVSLHADGDPEGVARGFKLAHGSRRGPYEDHLVQVLTDEYAAATGLPLDHRITRNMLGYYAFSWSRFTASAAPHTPAAILEMGFISSAADRAVLFGRQHVVVAGVVRGIERFLHEVPAGAAFADDLVVPARPARPPSTISPAR
jgi:N-acetylmuramoyl-L-alanine amidase